MTIKTCITCANYRSPLAVNECEAPQNIRVTPDYVNGGEKAVHIWMRAENARTPQENACGPEARWHVPIVKEAA